EDPTFSRVIATSNAIASAESDWTCRVLVGNLKSSSIYWYRFIDEQGCASLVGRTVTAPQDQDDRPVRFAFVSCQTVNEGALHAYRRMAFEDERAQKADRLDFVLHLGDFIYETVYYPEDNPNGLNGRRIRESVRYGQGEKVGTFHIPTTLED